MLVANRNYCFSLATLCVAFVALHGGSASGADENFERWEKSIRAFEEQDEKSSPPQGATLFAGSSSIRLWDLEKYFPENAVINRGFGGSQIADSVHFADRIIIKHRPKLVLLYAGDNDVASGKSAERVAADFAEFVETIHKELPETKIAFIAIKPSLKRWSLVEEIRKANAMVKSQCEESDLLTYIDIFEPMLGEDGKPMPGLFAKDGLHLNSDGYQLWTKVVNDTVKLAGD